MHRKNPSTEYWSLNCSSHLDIYSMSASLSTRIPPPHLRVIAITLMMLCRRRQLISLCVSFVFRFLPYNPPRFARRKRMSLAQDFLWFIEIHTAAVCRSASSHCCRPQTARDTRKKISQTWERTLKAKFNENLFSGRLQFFILQLSLFARYVAGTCLLPCCRGVLDLLAWCSLFAI